MARNKGMSAQKRLRERQRAERAELKREARKLAGKGEREAGAQVARREDLEGYGIIRGGEEPEER
jgi:hypothetical protein